ncbi:MAG: WD40 repeat domain-containing protein [Thermotogota bacterium]|nr:WD40 repeat domain-containing protein [Thermotogota bacterium]
MSLNKINFLIVVGLTILSTLIFSVPKILATTDSMIVPNAFALDNSKNRLYAGYSNGKTVIWNIATGELDEIIFDMDIQSPTSSVAISNDSNMLASGHKDGTMEIWNLDPHRKHGDFIREGNTIWDILFSEDNLYVYTANADGKLRRWNIETKILENIYTRHRRTVNSAQFSPDSPFLATGSSDNSIILWNIEDGEFEDVMSAHLGWITSLSFSPNGRYLISGSTDKKVMVWAIPRGYLLRESQVFPSEVWATAFVNNEEVVIGEASGDLSLWNMETAKEMRRVKNAHNASIRAISHCETSSHIFTASNDGTIKIWDDDSLNLIATLSIAKNGEWISYMPLGKYISSINALNRNDFYINDEGEHYTFDRYKDFLMKVDYLPIGDIFGPEITPLNLQINPRDTELSFSVVDDSNVKTVEDSINTYTFDKKEVELAIPYDIWSRDSSLVDLRALDSYGNESREQFQVVFIGFRFYMKEDFEDLKKSAVVLLDSIKDGAFVIKDDLGEKHTVPKDKVILTPYAPDIDIEIIYPDNGWTQTKSGIGSDVQQIIYDVEISDVMGVDEVIINDQTIDISQPVKKFESTQGQTLHFGENHLSVTATNIENIVSTASLTIVRTEKISPEIIMPQIPSQVYSDRYTITIGVRDNFEVEKLLVNNVNYPIKKQYEEVNLELPINRGENIFEVQVFDWFNNSATSRFAINGARIMYANKEGVKVIDSNNQILDILMMGDTVVTLEETGRYYRVLIEEQEGLILSREVQLSPPDVLSPGLTNMQAKIMGDHILITGIAYDDVSVANIKVGGNYILSTREVNINIPNYRVGVAKAFEYKLMISSEELFPVEIEVIDDTGKKTQSTVIPRL